VLRTERQSFDSKKATMPGVLSSIRGAGTGPANTWQHRLRRRMSFATSSQATDFINNVATPAVEEVAAELSKLAAAVRCQRGPHPEYPIPCRELVVHVPGQDASIHEPYAVAHNVPDLATNLAAHEGIYFKVVILTLTGSEGQDSMYYTKDEVISG